MGIASLVLNEIFQETLTEEINREATLLKLLTKSAFRKNNIRWSANVGGSAATGQSITSDAPAVSSDLVLPAGLGISSYSFQSSFNLNARELEAAKEQVSNAELRNMAKYHMTTSIDEMMNAINKKLYTGTGVEADGGVFGLARAVGIADYAGIDATAYPLWRSSINTNLDANGAPKALGQNALFNIDQQVRVKGGRYDVIVTHPAVLAEYKKLFASVRSFVVNGNSLADLGFGMGEYAGTPIIDDPFCPLETVTVASGPGAGTYTVGRMYFLKARDLEFYSVPTEGSTAMSGLYTQMEALSKAGLYVQKYAVGTICQLQLRTRKNTALLSNILIQNN